jgi:pimeloyl-ACP methyl ester carboxylesterase
VLTLDYAGTGQSDSTERACSTRAFARDAVRVLDGLGIDRSHVYGISMGGRVAQWLAVDFAERVGALVLGGTTPGSPHGVRRTREIDEEMATPDVERRVVRMSRHMVSEAFLRDHPEVSVEVARMIAPPITAEARFAHFVASEGHDTGAVLGCIRAPTLILHGSLDAVNPTANAPLLAQRIPGAELVIFDGARHLYQLEFRDKASGRVLAFLKKHAERVTVREPRS